MPLLLKMQYNLKVMLSLPDQVLSNKRLQYMFFHVLVFRNGQQILYCTDTKHRHSYIKFYFGFGIRFSFSDNLYIFRFLLTHFPSTVKMRCKKMKTSHSAPADGVKLRSVFKWKLTTYLKVPFFHDTSNSLRCLWTVYHVTVFFSKLLVPWCVSNSIVVFRSSSLRASVLTFYITGGIYMLSLHSYTQNQCLLFPL